MFVYVLASIVKIGAICNLKGKVLGTMPNISFGDIQREGKRK